MKVAIKPGVKLNGLKPETLLGMMIAKETFAPYDFVITEVSPTGKHKNNSLHNVGYAFDCRTRHISRNKAELVIAQLQKNLGDEWDVILESDHAHLEYQP